MLVFSTQLCELSNLHSGSTLPPPFPVSKHSIYRQCVAGRAWGVLSPVGYHRYSAGVNTCRKVPLQVNFFRWRHFALVSISLMNPWVKGMLDLDRVPLDFSKQIRWWTLFCSTRRQSARQKGGQQSRNVSGQLLFNIPYCFFALICYSLPLMSRFLSILNVKGHT